MNTTCSVVLTILCTISITSCKNDRDLDLTGKKKELIKSDEQENTVYGLIYREIDEIPQLKNYEHQAGSVIDNPEIQGTNYKHAVTHFKKGNIDLIILEEIIHEQNSPKVKYKILDTLIVQKLKKDEQISLTSCNINGVYDAEIVALVKADYSKEYLRVIKAWRTDTKSGQIHPIKNLKNIECVNEGYGLDGCGEEDYPESDGIMPLERDSV